eukprot:2536427-Heterocapsa_arctica.AAC.1
MDFDVRQSNSAWKSWLCDGPAKSLSRHHKLSRVATGWVPSPLAIEAHEDDDTEISDEDPWLVLVEGAEGQYSSPMSSQAEVDAEAI